MNRTCTRREVLTAFLGLPAALAACRTRPSFPLPDGEIVGTSYDIGHRLRDGLRVAVSADKWERKRVVIVGGGVAGLTAAWRLLNSGCSDFVLLELEAVPGGTARSGASPVISYPWGAHYLPVPMKENAALLGLLDEMGMTEGRAEDGSPVVAEQYLCRDPEERVFYRGRWYEGLYLRAGASAEDLAQLDRFNAEINRWVAWRDGRGRRAFAIPVATASDDAEVTALDKVSMAGWLDQRGFSSPRLRWFIEYGCRDDYGLVLENTSAWAGLFYFAARMQKPGHETQPFMTWPEGNGRLVAHLYGRAKSQVRTGLAVTEIIPTDPDGKSGADVIAVDHGGSAAVGFHAERVIFAAPHFLAPYVIRPWRESPPAHVAEFHYGSWMVANLHLKERPESRGFPLAWDNVLYDSPALGYVVATHQRGLDRGPTVFTYYYPLAETDQKAARNKLLSADCTEWADVVLSDLQRAHPEIRGLVTRLDVMRWGHAMISPRPGFVWSSARREAAKPHRGIHFAHSDLSGVALFEEAFDQGSRAADEVLRKFN
ncbi:MAG TPA: FAD-dependent oxidoreductase [Blastocatellia bacterium]|nr:FAD-dependent oxidoreductase [Blastocatellia bacterium]